jgi:hypothetical protein
MAASRNDPPIETFSVLAQLVEQLTVNQRVAGSSPADGAIFPKLIKELHGLWVPWTAKPWVTGMNVGYFLAAPTPLDHRNLA